MKINTALTAVKGRKKGSACASALLHFVKSWLHIHQLQSTTTLLMELPLSWNRCHCVQATPSLLMETVSCQKRTC